MGDAAGGLAWNCPCSWPGLFSAWPCCWTLRIHYNRLLRTESVAYPYKRACPGRLLLCSVLEGIPAEDSGGRTPP